MSVLIRFYWHLFLRRAPVLVAIVVLFSAFGLAFAVSQPDKYSSSARLLVEPPQIPVELAASTVETAIAEELGIIENRLVTRTNLIDIANKFDVFPADDNGERPSPNFIADAMRAATTVKSTARRNQAAFIDITFDASDPNVAAAVVNEFVTRALQDNVRMRTEKAGDTLEFFEREVERLTEELSRQSGRIADFKSENADTLPDALNFRLNRETSLESRLASLQRERGSIDEQRDRVLAVYEETGRLSRSEEDQTPEERQLRTLESELTSALAVYSENNPRVTVLKTRIEQLRKVVAGQTVEGASATPGSSVLNVTLAELDAKAKSLDVEIEDVAAELARLRRQIEETPKTAIVLDALSRDYDIIQSQYDAAVRGLARAKTGEQIELTAKGQRISVVENAVPPLYPSSPNRKVITAAGGLAGVAIAAGLFAFLELINSAIRRPGELVNRVGITPFSTIPHIQTSREKKMTSLKQAAVVLFLFVILPGVLFIVDQYVISLGEVVQRLRELV